MHVIKMIVSLGAKGSIRVLKVNDQCTMIVVLKFREGEFDG